MSPERRYSETEIKEIFSRASEHQRAVQRMSAGRGLTLSELQDIGREAGIAPELVVKAAASLDHEIDRLPPTSYFGVPVTVGHTVRLPGPMSEDQWERLVVDLRDTFRASGEVRNEGGLRQWRNGNLHALVEPTDDGSQLRIQSLHEAARAQLFGGGLFFLINLAFIIVLASSGKPLFNPDALIIWMMAVAGLGTAGYAVYRLPRWIRKRSQQMQAVASRALERAGVQMPISTAQTSDGVQIAADVELTDAGHDETEERQDDHAPPLRTRNRS